MVLSDISWCLPIRKRAGIHSLQATSVARPGTPPRPRWQRGLAWGVGLGLLVVLVSSAPWLWRARRPPLLSPSPVRHSDQTAAAFLAAAALTTPPAAAGRPAAPGQSSPVRASIPGAVPSGSAPAGLRQRPPASLAQGAAPRRPKAIAPPRAARVGGPHRSGERSIAQPVPQASARWITPKPPPKLEQPWNWDVIPETGGG
jgi:hypothetical protein